MKMKIEMKRVKLIYSNILETNDLTSFSSRCLLKRSLYLQFQYSSSTSASCPHKQNFMQPGIHTKIFDWIIFFLWKYKDNNDVTIADYPTVQILIS